MKRSIIKYLVIAIIVIVGIGVGFLFFNSEIVLKYNYRDNSIPGQEYYVRLNFITKKLSVKNISYSSTVDDQTHNFENEIILTDEEITMIKKIIKKANYNKEYLSSALESVTLGEKTMFKIDSLDENEKKFYESSIGYDVNNDGVITEREYGNGFLKTIIDEM